MKKEAGDSGPKNVGGSKINPFGENRKDVIKPLDEGGMEPIHQNVDPDELKSPK